MTDEEKLRVCVDALRKIESRCNRGHAVWGDWGETFMREAGATAKTALDEIGASVLETAAD